MKVKILGCSGSEAIGHNPPGFLVNDVVMLDAGTITAALSIQAQSRITDIPTSTQFSHKHSSSKRRERFGSIFDSGPSTDSVPK